MLNNSKIYIRFANCKIKMREREESKNTKEKGVGCSFYEE